MFCTRSYTEVTDVQALVGTVEDYLKDFNATRWVHVAHDVAC